MSHLSIHVISNNGKTVRTAGTLEEPFFLAKDVVEAVGSVWKRIDSIKHVPEEFRGQLDWPLPNGAITQAWYLTELGLYFYLNRSDSYLALPWQKKVAEILRELHLQGTVNSDVFHKLQYDYNSLVVENEHLAEQNILLARKLRMYRGGVGTFSIHEVAIHLMQNGLGNGNVGRLVDKMVEHGLLQKDTSIKKQTFYRPFLKDYRKGYFVARLDSSNDPIPVVQSNIVLTLAGLNWVTSEFQRLETNEFAHRSPLIRYSDYMQYRLSFLNDHAKLSAETKIG